MKLMKQVVFLIFIQHLHLFSPYDGTDIYTSIGCIDKGYPTNLT